MGIDPGLALTGWGVINYSAKAVKLVDFGSIATPAKTSLAERLKDIFGDMQSLIKKFKPDIVAVEKLFFNTNAKTALLVGQARGAIILAAALTNANIREFTPLQIKLNVAGYGHAEKIQVQRMVQRLLALASLPKPDDAADALAVAITCAYSKTENYSK